MDKKESLKIYSDIIEQTDEIMTQMRKNAEKNGDQEIKEQAKNTLEILSVEKQGLENSILELEKNSNWDTFTIAFYGETNAGKSTLIETLRLHLKEKTKLKQQEQFQNKSSSLSSIMEKIKNLESEKSTNYAEQKNLKDEISAIEKRKKEATEEYDLSVVELKKEEIVLSQNIETSSIWESLLFLIPASIRLKLGIRTTKLERNKLIQEAKLKHKNKILKDCDKEIGKINLKLKKLDAKNDDFEKKLKHQNNKKGKEFKKLAPYMDGAIIGDGRSDYTRETISYDFEISGKDFAVLDLPGIEGNEKRVQDEIRQSLQKAHIVFYITPKAAPPQSGDDNQTGTLNKIAKQLGDQTQVYAIYNHRITNPMALRDSLITADEKTALKELDAKMKEILKQHYKSTLSFSGLPAFLSMAQNLADLDGKTLRSSQEKFLNKFSKEDILKKSCFDNFISLIRDEMLLRSDEKIIEANKNKVISVIGVLISKLEEKILKALKEFAKKVEKERQQFDRAIDNEFDVFKRDLEKHANNTVEEFKNNVHKQAYAFIDKDVKDDKLKEKLKDIFEQAWKNAAANFRKKAKKAGLEYEESLKRELKRFEQHIKGFEKIFELEIKGNLNIDMKIKNWNWQLSLKIGGASIGIIGVAIGAIVAGAGAALALPIAVIVATLTGIIVAIWDFLKGKESRQRKFVNESTDKIKKQLSEKLKDAREQIAVQTDEKVDDLKERILEFVKITKRMEKTIGDFIEFLKKVKQSV